MGITIAVQVDAGGVWAYRLICFQLEVTNATLSVSPVHAVKGILTTLTVYGHMLPTHCVRAVKVTRVDAPSQHLVSATYQRSRGKSHLSYGLTVVGIKILFSSWGCADKISLLSSPFFLMLFRVCVRG